MRNLNQSEVNTISGGQNHYAFECSINLDNYNLSESQYNKINSLMDQYDADKISFNEFASAMWSYADDYYIEYGVGQYTV